jgi:protein involved in polysaccharide export with SLBB domain
MTLHQAFPRNVFLCVVLALLLMSDCRWVNAQERGDKAETPVEAESSQPAEGKAVLTDTSETSQENRDQEKPSPEKSRQEKTGADKGAVAGENRLPAKANEPYYGEIPALFGYEVFSRFAPGASPQGRGPVGPDYVVGPGDSFQILIWGQEEISFSADIGPDGELMLPRFGPTQAAGLTFEELKAVIREAVSERLRDFELRVIPTKRRSNRIFVLGEVRAPGVFELEGGVTAYSALFAAGGPTFRGTLRNIELRRGTRLVARIDLYDFLMYGNRASDVPVQDGDVIFVPLIGPTVSVTGAVMRPASFELKPEELRLKHALTMAGEILPTANPGDVRIDRVIAHAKRSVFSVPLGKAGASEAVGGTILQNLDRIHVFSISPREQDVVTLEGHVFEPGPRPWRIGMKLSGLLTSPKLLKKDAFLDYGEIYREIGLTGEVHLLSFHPGQVLARVPAADVELFARDRIVVKSSDEIHEKSGVAVWGEVMRPGVFSLTAGMTIKDLIFLSGGLKAAGSVKNAELTRRSPDSGETVFSRREIDIEAALKNDSRHNLLLEKFDSLIVRTVPNWSGELFVTLQGEFRFPGRYSFQRGERLSSVVERAGGFSPEAYLKAARFQRVSVLHEQTANARRIQKMDAKERRVAAFRSGLNDSARNGSAKEEKRLSTLQAQIIDELDSFEPTGRMILRLDASEMLKASSADLVLEDGDSLFVPSRPSTVMVEGAVLNPAVILFEPKKSLGFYLKKAGGVTGYGAGHQAYLIRADGTAESRGRRPWRCFADTLVEPGDTIWVPSRHHSLSRNVWQKTATITQILSNLALTALAVQNASE